VQLNPSERGTREFARPSLNYTPHSAPEVIGIDVKTAEYGWDYAIRFVVRWEDVETRTKHMTKTPVMIAAFPQQGAGLMGNSEELVAERQRRLRVWQERFDGKTTEIHSRIADANPWLGGSELCPQNTAETSSMDRFGPCRFEKRGDKIVEYLTAGRACLSSARPDRVCLIVKGCPNNVGRMLKKASFGTGKLALVCEQ
jgi:hypothetical protein